MNVASSIYAGTLIRLHQLGCPPLKRGDNRRTCSSVIARTAWSAPWKGLEQRLTWSKHCVQVRRCLLLHAKCKLRIMPLSKVLFHPGNHSPCQNRAHSEASNLRMNILGSISKLLFKFLFNYCEMKIIPSPSQGYREQTGSPWIHVSRIQRPDK